VFWIASRVVVGNSNVQNVVLALHTTQISKTLPQRGNRLLRLADSVTGLRPMYPIRGTSGPRCSADRKAMGQGSPSSIERDASSSSHPCAGKTPRVRSACQKSSCSW
jgi:hypothetical protein